MRQYHPGQEHVYAAADRWINAALKSDDSLFTPGTPIWNADRLADLRQRFVEQPDESDDRFEVKLERQLAGAPPETIQLMAELIYFHLLAAHPGSISGGTKRWLVDKVLGWSSDPVSVPEELDPAFDHGLAATGIAFLTYRPFQLMILVAFAEKWKGLSAEERAEAFEDPWIFKELVHGISAKGAYAQREALLHLVHPDTFEPIVSRDQKKRISDAFADLVPDEVTDVDRRLLLARESLSSEHGARFSWHHEDLRRIWEPSSSPGRGSSTSFPRSTKGGRLQAHDRTETRTPDNRPGRVSRGRSGRAPKGSEHQSGRPSGPGLLRRVGGGQLGVCRGEGARWLKMNPTSQTVSARSRIPS